MLASTTNRYTYKSPPSTGNGANAAAVGVDMFNTNGGSGTGGTTTAPTGTVVVGAGSTAGAGTPAMFTCNAVGNIDADATTDNWHVNDIKQNLQTPDQNDVNI